MATRKRRARKYPVGQKSAVVNFRITPETRRLLEKAAESSGRTVSSETEYQLQRALSTMAPAPTYALLAIIGRAINDLTETRDRATPRAKVRVAWWLDPRLFALAETAVIAAFRLLRPPGATDQIDDGRQGEFAIETLLREIQTVDLAKPFGQMSEHERWLALLRQDLGPLANRAAVWGESVEQARERHVRALPVLRDLIPLSRKSPGDLTKEEVERLAELRAEIERLSRIG
jgi:hypothetical protein